MTVREQSELRRCFIDVTTNFRESFYTIWRMLIINLFVESPFTLKNLIY